MSEDLLGKALLEKLLGIIEKQSKAIEELKIELDEARRERSSSRQISDEGYKEHHLHSSGMSRAIDKVLEDFRELKYEKGG